MTIARDPDTLPARKPRAVLFDIDNTLYAYDPAHKLAMRAVTEKAQTLGLDGGDFIAAFDKARGIIKERLGSTAASHSRLLYMQHALELLGLKTQLYMALDLEQTYWRTFLSNAALFPGVKEFLQTLRRAGIATAVVTDLDAHIQFRKLIYFDLNDCFDFVVTSEEAGAEKPAAAPFELALEKLAVGTMDAVMIGDSAECDIAGANRLDIITAQKRHTGVQTLAGDGKPDIVFDDFAELERHFVGFGWLAADAANTPAKKKKA